MMKMKKIADWFVIGCFAVFLAVIGGWTLTHPSETVSFYENRMLSAQPQASWSALLSGRYFDDWESFFTDHAAGRDTLMKTDTALRMSVLRLPAVNNVVVTKSVLLPLIKADRPDAQRIDTFAQNMADAVGALSDQVAAYGGHFYYVGVPEQYSYFRDRFPAEVRSGQRALTMIRETFSADLAAKNVPFLDMCAAYDELGRPDSLYYATDHHYTIGGALEVYDRLTARLAADGVPVRILARDEWKLTTLPNPFLGSRDRKLYNLWHTDDRLTYAEPKTAIPFTRTDGGTEVDSLISLPQNAAETVTYDAFMGGDKAESVVRTDRPELPNVLIYGDSFTNALETLLYASFNEMRALDLRHYTGMKLSEYIEKYRPDVVICVRDDSSFLMTGGNGAAD